MPDVSIYVAVISACAGIGGAAVPHYADARRADRQAALDRSDRRSEAKRQACMELLRSAGELRTLVTNAALYHGEEMGARLEQARACADAVHLNAVSVGLLAAGSLTAPAQRLAGAARGLAAAAAENTDRRANQMTRTPDFTEFDESLAAFSQIAVSEAEQ